MNLKISVVVITLNEQDTITRCLKSVKWADDILVVDTGSEDDTIALSKAEGARVIKNEWLGFGKTKQFAVSKAKHEWVLSLDADEWLSKQLQEKIQKLFENSDTLTHWAFSIKRVSYFLGKLIQHCGWDKDYPCRLFNRYHAHFNTVNIHEEVIVENGECGSIHEHLFHIPYKNISAHFQKMNSYTTLVAQQKTKLGKKVTSPWYAFLRALAEFAKKYFLKLGFLDGTEGFVLCLNASIYVYIKYLKFWEAHAIKLKKMNEL